MAAARRRSTADIVFQGRSLGHDLLPQLWQRGGTQLWRYTRERVNRARGLRLKTSTVQLRETWVKRHPEAADWVVKVLPERRTLERDLIAAVADVEPTYSRVAIGDTDTAHDQATACENYLETWRKQTVPFQTFAEKGTEDGPYGVLVLPTDVDMAGCPDFYDRLDAAAYDALDEQAQADYAPDETDAKGRYARMRADGTKRPNPRYDRSADGKPRTPGDAGFQRDDQRSKDAHASAVQRYLLKQEQGAVTVRVVPANDCVPFLTRGTRRERWKLSAMVERTLYYPEELLSQGYGWRGMGDRALIPQGFDAERGTGQNGMFYLYTLYWVWVDPEDPQKIERPLIVYSVGGHPTWVEQPEPEDRDMADQGIAIIDLFETHGLQGAFWGFFGGLHTSDDSPDFYWEPYLWPLAETITGLEGMQTATNAAIATNAFTGYFHKPDAALVGEGGVSDEALIDSDTQALRKPVMPDAGEIETVVGEVFPATPATVSPDVWRAIQAEYASLHQATQLEQAGAGAEPSGHAMVVRASIAQTAKRHIREGAADAVRFCGEKALRIFHAISVEHAVNWPLQTVNERPVGSELRSEGSVLEFDPAWVGDGEYKLTCLYPPEYNPVLVQTLMSGVQLGLNAPEEVWEAQGITDTETQWARVLKWKIRQTPAYIEAQTTRLAKKQGNALMLQVLKLQQQQKMTASGPAGYETGFPTAVLNGPGGGGGGGGGLPGGAPGGGGPTLAQRSLGGQVAAQVGPAMNDARATAPLQQGAA